MKLPRPVLLAARAAFTLYFVLTSAYCLLAYVPFTYLQFLHLQLVPWVVWFAKAHAWLWWIAVAFGGATVAGGLSERRTRALTAVFLGASGLAGILLALRPLLPRLGNDPSSAAWCVAALVPLVWVAAIDLAGPGSGPATPAARGSDADARAPSGAQQIDPAEDRRVFCAAVGSALFITLVYWTVFCIRTRSETGTGLGARGELFSLLWSAASHLVVFLALFLALMLVRGLAALFPARWRTELWLAAALLGVASAFAIRRIVFAAISFTGTAATLLAAGIGAVLALSIAGLAVRAREEESAERAGRSGIGLLLSPLAPARLTSWPARVLWAVALGVAGCAAAVWSAAMDWNYLFQKLSALAIWAAAFAGIYRMTAARSRGRDLGAALVLLAALGAGGYRALWAGQSRLASAAFGAGLDAAHTLDRYAGYDPSFRMIHELLAPHEVDDTQFFEFLQQHTNIGRDIPIAPSSVDLDPALRGSAGEKPNIFIFVIDSLRQDYLSPYNPSVGFTPEIARFAKDSVVFRRAFTRYGATGLSEPSIWVGGMIVHKQYVTPFAPMNSLQKLIRAEGYERFLSMDSLLRAIVEPGPDLVDIDEGVQERDYGFCRSLTSLLALMEAPGPRGRPIFAYSQPQDIHISAITRQGASVPPGETYPGFYAPYASRIRRLDACFGAFLAELDRRGLYRKSIVILTSDHGDSLGEDGRWGHAYTLFPEIIRVPLIVHLPEELRSTVVCDPDRMAFLTDITPSLYALLGHPPSLRSDMFGVPLFVKSRAELPDRTRDEFLIASSYGPVYGLLRNDGRSLYVVDAINYLDYQFDLAEDPKGTKNLVSAADRAESARTIRRKVEDLHAFYKAPLPR